MKITDFYWDADNLIFPDTYQVFRGFAKKNYNEEFPESPYDFNEMEKKDMPHLSQTEISSMFQAFNNSKELYAMKIDPMILKIMAHNKRNGIKNHILTARPEYTRNQTLVCLEQNEVFKYMEQEDVHLLNYFENNTENKKKEKHEVILETQTGISIFCDDSLAHLIGARQNCKDVILFGPELSWLRKEQVKNIDVTLYKNTQELHESVIKLINKRNLQTVDVEARTFTD